MYRTLLSAAVAVAMSATMVLAQNARIISLGTPTMQGVNMVEDVSDILYFPSDVSINKDMAQGAWNNHVFITKELMDMFTLGFAFGLPTTVTSSLGANSTFDGALRTAFTDAQNNANLPPNFSPNSIVGDFDLTMPATPSNAGHMLLGMDMGGMQLGVDLFREASKSHEKGTVVTDNGVTTTTIDGEGHSNYGALGGIAGIGIDLGIMDLKASAGFISLNYAGEVVYSGNSVANTGGATTTLRTETSNLDATSGIQIPILLRGKMEMGADHTLFGMLNYSFNSYAFEAKFDDDDASTDVDPYETSGFSNTFMGLSVADDMKISDNTHLIGALQVSRASTKEVPTNVDDVTPEVVNSNVTFPAITIGIEHTINNWWKFDEVILRAGGNKGVTWTTTSQKGTDTDVSTSSSQNVTAFAWTTGLSLIKKNFELAMCVAPARWNGLYLISGGVAGPLGTTVTMTYHFGNASPAPASGSSYDSYQTPSYETPSYSDPVDEDGLDF